MVRDSSISQLIDIVDTETLAATNQEVLRLLERHATVLAQKASQQLDVPASFETAFQEFIQSLEAGGYRPFFLHEPNASETLAYYRFWKEDKLVI